MLYPKTSACIALLILLGLSSGCEEKKPAPEASKAAETAAALPPAAPTPSPTPAKTAEPPSERTERPKQLDTELTDARRTAIQAKYPRAAGFLVAKDLEDKLKANKTLKDKKTGIAAFDKLAKGKWLLFTGPAVNLKPESFDVGIVYTPQLPGDVMGMSRQFFEVTLTEIEGYAQEKFKTGDVVAVIAQYSGGGKAGPGHELVATDVWK
jgi:hypothetical protein